MLILPYKDENPVHRFAIMTFLLIVVNVAVFLYELQLAQAGTLQATLLDWAVVPRDVANGIGQEQALDLIRSMFLHGGWLHLLGNMLYLGIFGDNVEDALGSVRFLLFYLACGVIASLVQVWLTPGNSAPLVGASGAIAGVLGAYLVLYPGVRVRTLVWLIFILRTVRVPAIIILGLWFVLQFLNAYYAPGIGVPGDGVAYAAHVGGFIAGMLLTIPFGLGRALQPSSSSRVS